MNQLFTLPPDLTVSNFEWALAFFAAFLLGLSKAGIKGITIITVTIMALVFGSKESTGIVLPLLIFGDIFAVIYYNRHAQWQYLFRLIPWMMLGVLIGTLVGKDLPEYVFKRGMAIIILVSVVIMFWWENQKQRKIPTQWWFAGIMGFTAGFTTMIGNLAGAFSNIFFLAMRMPKDQFIGTAAWLFFIINLFKLPFHIFYWETVSMASFAINLRLLVFVGLGIMVGIQLVKKITDHNYRKFILIMTAIGALLIFFR